MREFNQLEAEAISILREAYARFKNPVILFSGGKDSMVLTHLAQKAFSPFQIPFKLMLIDTGHNFSETLSFIDDRVRELQTTLVTGSVEAAISQGIVQDVESASADNSQKIFSGRNRLQSKVLMMCISDNKFDAVVGGGRRDEEKSRAKERIFSVRDENGMWSAENQRPELWQYLNPYLQSRQHMRIFPLSNWTELDIWSYIQTENIKVPSIYFSHERKCVYFKNQILAHSQNMQIPESAVVKTAFVRCRTVGDMFSTGLIESTAANIKDVILEIKKSKVSERGLRLDDQFSDTAMEERKKEGYF